MYATSKRFDQNRVWPIVGVKEYADGILGNNNGEGGELCGFVRTTLEFCNSKNRHLQVTAMVSDILRGGVRVRFGHEENLGRGTARACKSRKDVRGWLACADDGIVVESSLSWFRWRGVVCVVFLGGRLL